MNSVYKMQWVYGVYYSAVINSLFIVQFVKEATIYVSGVWLPKYNVNEFVLLLIVMYIQIMQSQMEDSKKQGGLGTWQANPTY